LDRWLELAALDLSPTTLREYRRLIQRRIRPALGDMRLSRLNTADLDAFYAALTLRAELSPATVRQIHSILRRGLRQAVRWQWIHANPAVNATVPRIRRDEVSPPSPDTIRLVLATAAGRDPTLGALLITAAATGLRRGELCGLKWGDIDLKGSRIVVRHSIAAVPSGTVEKTTKTHASRRLALDASTVQVLANHRLHSLDLADAVGRPLDEDCYVFSRSADSRTPLHPDNVTAGFRRICARCGVTGARLHDLRHAHATQLLAAGVPVRTVSGRLGHASPMTTMNVYAHFLEESDEEAARVIGEILNIDSGGE
jgi:integrase